jgi:hypothetical protein
MTLPPPSFHFFSDGLTRVPVASWNCSSAVVLSLDLAFVCKLPPFRDDARGGTPPRSITDRS